MASNERELVIPEPCNAKVCHSADEAVTKLCEIYERSVLFLTEKIQTLDEDSIATCYFRAFYPEIIFETVNYGHADSRLSYGHVSDPGKYSTTVTRPNLFRNYLKEQINLLIENHGVPVTVKTSSTPIPLHFALGHNSDIATSFPNNSNFFLRDVFDTPDLTLMHDDFVNGVRFINDDGMKPLAPFTAPRIDYSLERLRHYTATNVEHFQTLVLFTNYQQYVDEFESFGRSAICNPELGYESLVLPGGQVIRHADEPACLPSRMPQMPACHLTRNDGNGITMVNIGVGPSNAKTATDHVAVLRPNVWLMLGHCAGLRYGQSLGDYVLAHAYLREDQVLDKDLPVWVPIPALAEVQKALESAVGSVTEVHGYDLKQIMRTGTIASTDNRNWELQTGNGSVQRLSQSRAIALDMESATIAANGFRFRVPYGTLLCVSDKPLHGELKLPGMADKFYKSQVSKHLKIGIVALETLRDMPKEFLHSRKLRSFEETAFL